MSKKITTNYIFEYGAPYPYVKIICSKCGRTFHVHDMLVKVGGIVDCHFDCGQKFKKGVDF